MKKIVVALVLILIFNPLLASYSSSIEFISAGKRVAKKSEEKKEEKTVKLKEINESEYESTLLGALLDTPEKFIGKKIKFRGKFSSFTNLALDYDPALRKSKDYISLCIFRPDTKIPLSELKLAYPLNEAKENTVIRDVEEGDLIEFYGQVFSAALGEPWVDIDSLKNLNTNKKENKEKVAEKSDDKSKKNKK